MRLTEVLVSILIVSLIMAAAFMSYGTCLKCAGNVKQNLVMQNKVLKADSQFRRRIRNIKISYLDDFESVLNAQTVSLLESFDDADGISIVSVENFMDKNDEAQGLKITWRAGNREFVTVERLNTRNIAGVKNEK